MGLLSVVSGPLPMRGLWRGTREIRGAARGGAECSGERRVCLNPKSEARNTRGTASVQTGGGGLGSRVIYTGVPMLENFSRVSNSLIKRFFVSNRTFTIYHFGIIRSIQGAGCLAMIGTRETTDR